MAYEVLETCMLMPGLTRGECASWVQAWGSIAAILAAVGIAWWQRHRDRREAAFAARVRAEVAATSILLKMSPILGCCRHIHAELTERLSDPRKLVDISHLGGLLNRLDYPLDDELLALVDHDARTARWLIQGRNLIRQAWLTLGLLESRIDGNSALNEQLPELISLFTMAISRFQGATANMEQLVPASDQ